MDSSVSPKDEIWFLSVCHHISNAVYNRQNEGMEELWVGGGGRDKDLAGWISYHYNSSDVNGGGVFP